MSELKEGMAAPLFTGKDQEGGVVRLEDFVGKKVILYFYPKDDTPGCTSEACNLRDHYTDLTGSGFEVIGVSADTEKSHQKFITKYDLPFTLISDTGKKILKAYGAWGLKKMYGKEYEGILRKTFVINENGMILKVFHKVDTKNHTAQVLSALEDQTNQ
jgi:peroxiredoxin Q/BCP